jgi:hypothetical protein
MANPYMPEVQAKYDPRWFVWTIVFLIVTGVSLVTYIVVSDTNNTDIPPQVTVSHHNK